MVYPVTVANWTSLRNIAFHRLANGSMQLADVGCMCTLLHFEYFEDKMLHVQVH